MYQLDSKNYWSDPRIPIQLEYRNPQSSFPLHVHDFHEITVIFSGRATHLTSLGNYEIQEGDVLSIKPGQSHGYKSVKDLVLMNILTKPSFLAEDHYGLTLDEGYQLLFGRESARHAGNKPILRFRLSPMNLFEGRALIESISREMTERIQGYEVQTVTLFLQFLLMLIRSYQDGVSGKNDAGILRVIKYLDKNFHRPLSMEDLIKISSMSESGMLRAFKKLTGYPPMAYLNHLRVQAAGAELLQTDKSITDIAMDAGFNDSNYFSRCFKKYMRVPPREYRRSRRLPSAGSAAAAETASAAGETAAPGTSP